jgi:hypothetical protein
MDFNDEKYKLEAKAFINALRDILEPSDDSLPVNQVMSPNYKLLKRIMADYQLIESGGSCDAFQLCRNIKKLAEITAKVPGLALQSTSLFRFHYFLAKEGGYFKIDKDKGSHGIPCMNMRTGLIYIS